MQTYGDMSLKNKKTGEAISQNLMRHIPFSGNNKYKRHRAKLRPVLSAVPQALLFSLLRFDPLPFLF
jgi:hypothetical protein